MATGSGYSPTSWCAIATLCSTFYGCGFRIRLTDSACDASAPIVEYPVTGVNEDRLPQLGQGRLTERVPGPHERGDKVARIVEKQVMGSQLALESGTVLDLSPRQTPTATTQ